MIPQTTVPLNAVAADTEYSISLPASVTAARIQNHSGHTLRVAFVTGKVATRTEPYIAIGAYETRDLGRIEYTAATTLYFASSLAGHYAILEVRGR